MSQAVEALRAMLGAEWIYRDAHYLAAEVELAPAVAARWVPSPLKLAKPARATVFTAYFPETTFGSVYREAGVFLHVEHWRRKAIYSPWMLVDDDVALIVGRELLGYPKKLGEITWQHDGDRIAAVVRRRGHEVMRMSGTLGAVEPAPPHSIIRHRPAASNVRSAIGVAVPTLIAFTPRERVIEVRTAALDVQITGTERDPLHTMGFGRVLGARLHRVDIGRSRLPLPVAIASPIAFVRDLLVRSH